MSTSPVSKNSGIYLTEPNNIFELQNEVTNKLNEFEKSRIHYIKCNDDSMPLSSGFSCSDNDFSKVENAYGNFYLALDKLETAMNSQDQSDPNAISKSQYEVNVNEINNHYEQLKSMRQNLDNQLEEYQRSVINNNEPELRLKSSQFIYMLSVIAIILLIYYIIIM